MIQYFILTTNKPKGLIILLKILSDNKNYILHVYCTFSFHVPINYLSFTKESPAKAYHQLQKTLLFVFEYLPPTSYTQNENREIVQYGNFFIRLHVLHHQVAEYNQLTDVGFIYLLA